MGQRSAGQRPQGEPPTGGGGESSRVSEHKIYAVIFCARMHLKPRHNILLDLDLGGTHTISMKRNDATEQGVDHGNQRNKKHIDDVKKSKALQERRKRDFEKGVVWVKREVADGIAKKDYPDFESDVSGLGIGECFSVLGGINLGGKDTKVETVKLSVEKDGVWEKKLRAAMRELDWWHVWQPRKLKKEVKYYWVRKKSKDRVKVKKSEKQRPLSDVCRETVDLRPDASRAVEYLIKIGRQKEVAEVLREIRLKKIELFERIYGRKVLFAAEHTDSGQHHDDLWHSGVFGTGEKIGLVRKDGKDKRRERIDRVEFHSYGIGVGACSWLRHMEALRENGVSEKEIETLAGPTLEAIESNIYHEEGRHGKPRDVQFLEELDTFVRGKLSALDPEICDKARDEYVKWICEGYQDGFLGVKKSAVEIAEEKVVSLEKEAASLRGELEAVRTGVSKLVEDVRVVVSHLGQDLFEKMKGAPDTVISALKRVLGVLGIHDDDHHSGDGGDGTGAVRPPGHSVMCKMTEIPSPPQMKRKTKEKDQGLPGQSR